VPLTEAERAKVKPLAKAMLDTLKARAADGERDTRTYLASLLTQFSGNGVRDTTWLSRLLTKTAEAFLDENAGFKLWAVTHFPTLALAANKNLRDHQLIAAIDRVKPYMSGVITELGPDFAALREKARKLGLPNKVRAEEIMVAAGEYVNALHALEANPALYQRWVDELAITKDEKRIADLNKRIAQYDVLKDINRNNDFTGDNFG